MKHAIDPSKLDRLPPQSIEAEQGVLGCILWSPNDSINECVLKFKGDSEVFYDLRHQTIFDTIVEMADKMEAVEIITLQQRLKDKGVLDQVGGIAYLSSLQDAVPSAANLGQYISIVVEKRILRQVIRTCTDIVGRAYLNADATEILDNAERDILNIRNYSGAESESIKTLCKKANDRLQEMFESGGKITGLSTGISDLDRMTDGLHGGEMIVMAAFPSCGKTSLAMQIATHVASLGQAVGVFSCEMTPLSIILRAICSESRVNRFSIRDGAVNDFDFKRLTTEIMRISSLPLHVENSNGWTIGQVVARSRRLKQQHNIGLVVIDYIQLLSCQADSREQEISGVSKGVKSIAMQLDIPVIALSQLNDDGKLRESRAIGQDADGVWILQNDGDRVPKDQPVTLTIQKGKDSEIGKIELLFRKQYTRFEQVSKIHDSDVP